MTTTDWTAIEALKATRIRELLAKAAHEIGDTMAIADAARLLPLVGWDTDLALELFNQEVEAEIAREDAAALRRRANRTR
jgi:hypothetical protein